MQIVRKPRALHRMDDPEAIKYAEDKRSRRRARNLKMAAIAPLVILAVILSLGCASSAPQAIQDSLAGEVRDLRIIKGELVQELPQGDRREVWLKRIAAFIVRARANQAWASGESAFDTLKAFDEELARVEPDQGRPPG